jgi:hypothetical protein
MSFQAQTEQTWLRIRLRRSRQPRSPGSVRGPPWADAFHRGPVPPYLHRTSSPATPTRRRPAFVPRTTGRRQETTRSAGATNRQVRRHIRLSSLVAKSGSRTLSRWSHRFEPRWDYFQGLIRTRAREEWREDLRELRTRGPPVLHVDGLEHRLVEPTAHRRSSL